MAAFSVTVMNTYYILSFLLGLIKTEIQTSLFVFIYSDTMYTIKPNLISGLLPRVVLNVLVFSLPRAEIKIDPHE